jgi:CBS domain-containing protein
MNVEQIMIRGVKVCRPNDSLNVAAKLMWDTDCGFLPVVSSDGSGKVIGVITDRDICMCAYTQGKRLVEIPVATAMANRIIWCEPEDEVGKAEAIMRADRVHRLPVIDKSGRLAGVISLHDIAREAHRELEVGGRNLSQREVAETLAGICEGYHAKPERT